MDSKVFISHSNKDKAIADAICEHLESAGARCWIAPRDIEAGTEWTEGIMRGIASAGPLQPHLTVLSELVKRLLEGREHGASLSEIGQKSELKRGYTAGRKKRHWLSAAGLAGVAAVVASALWFFLVSERRWNESNAISPVSAIPVKTVAVLPFESLSESKEDAYFAEGVQDEILNKVAKIANLTVISRTSVMQYRAGEKRDLRQIAKALGVTNVLEGTVRRNGNRVRVSTELIDARRDTTTWADSFDRDLTDVFAIQSEVAQIIAAKLAATLSPEEQNELTAFLFHLRHRGDVAYQAKLKVRVDDKDPSHWLTPEEFEKRLDAG